MVDREVGQSRARRRGIGVKVWWRQLRRDAWADVAIAVTIAITCFVLSSAPRVFWHASQEDLSEAIATATPEQRNLVFESRDTIGAGPNTDPFVNLDLFGKRLRNEHIPENVESLLADQSWIIDSASFVVSSYPDQLPGPFPSTFRFRYQDDIDSHSRIVSGHAPTLRDPILRLEGTECSPDATVDDFEPVEDVDCRLVVLPFFETALTQQSADDLGLAVGDRVTLTPSPNDVLFRSGLFNAGALRFVLEVSGIVELDEPGLEYWYADSSLHRPRITENPDFRLIFAVGLMSPDQYRTLRNALNGVPFKFGWRFLVDPDLVQGADAEVLRDEIAKISAPGVDLVTLLPDLLGAHLDQRRQTLALLSMAAVGIGVAALASILVLAAVDGTRRERTSSLLVDRGASGGQMAVHALRTAALTSIPVAVIAAFASWALVPDAPVWPSLQPLAIVAAIAIVSVVTIGVPARRAADRRGRRIRRLVLEGATVGAASAVIVLLRRRDQTVADASNDGFDILLASAPAIVAVVAAIVTLRLIGPIAIVLARLAARRRAAGWFVGVRRLISQPFAVRAPVATIALASAIAVFAALVTASLDRSRELASWHAVGAAARVETGNPDLPLPSQLQTAIAEHAESVSYGTHFRFQRFGSDGGGFVADLLALDLGELDALLPRQVARDLVGGGVTLVQDDPEVLPALLVGFSNVRTPRVGEVARLLSGAFAIPTEMVRATDRFPGVASERPTIIIDREMLRRLTDERTVAPTLALLGGELMVDGLDAAVSDPKVLARWATRSDHLADSSGDPLSTWTSRSVWALGLAGVLVALVTATASAVITAAARRRDVGVMAVLGLDRRSAARLIATELIPGVVLAAACGAVGGVAGAWLLGENLSLGTFSGEIGRATIAVDWRATTGVVLALLLASIGAVLVTARSVRRIDHAMLLRRGDL